MPVVHLAFDDDDHCDCPILGELKGFVYVFGVRFDTLLCRSV